MDGKTADVSVGSGIDRRNSIRPLPIESERGIRLFVRARSLSASVVREPERKTEMHPALVVMRGILAKVSDTASLEAEVGKAERSLDEAVILFQDYISKNAITEADLTDGKYMELETKYNRSMEKVESLRAELTSRMRRAAAIERFIEKVSGYTEVFQEFSEEAWLGLAEKIIVKDKGSYIVKFKNGIEIPVEA